MDEYYIWIGFPRSSPEYIRGIKAILKNAFPIYKNGDQMKCPCKKCTERNWYCQDVIYDHLVCNGPSPLHADWICEVSQTKLGGTDDFEDCEMGIEFEDNLDAIFNYTRKNFENQGGCEDEPNADAKKFFRHVEEGKQPLYPGCTTFSRLSFLIRFYHLKCVYGISEPAFGELLKLIKEAFPDANLPLSFNAAKSVIRDLGLDYEKIHVCPNSCMLYWGKNKEKNECETCGVSRWVVHKKDGIVENNDPPKIHKVAANVMRYFPLRSRLQRMFLCKDFSRLMRWHALGRTKDGKLRHSADVLAWKAMDARYPDFAAKNRNFRLGVAADGFNPYSSMNLSHSTWPIVLVNYNLPLAMYETRKSDFVHVNIRSGFS
ncbi:uncharacterized protein LOC141691710 [Apium graveolens]|uniref:uncharacterized protein LOC141691710 n=1 Tax=Apium graveolens TaxID=4045 RepID=UPI003D79D6E0